MAAKYQIFISSTYEDLREEREEVIRAVLEMGHIPVGMEMFSAADEQQWQIIARHIDESDYYVVIVAHRYGSMTDGMSYTRKEYEYALEKGVPALGFLIDPKSPWPANYVDSSEPEATLLDDFKKRIQEKPVGYWSNRDDLHSKCSIALMKAFTASPRDGWVRASAMAGPEVTAELSRLSAENARLRQELETAAKESEADRAVALAKLASTLNNTPRQITYRYTAREGWEPAVPTTLGAIFRLIAPMMFVEYSVRDISKFLALNFKEDENRPSDLIPLNQAREFLTDLMTLDLVAPSAKKHSVNDSEEYWCLSELGQELTKWVRRRSIEREVERAAAPIAKPDAKEPTPVKSTKKAVPPKRAAKKAIL